jgi:Gluconate 2-dehydrogenase subunit 3
MAILDHEVGHPPFEVHSSSSLFSRRDLIRAALFASAASALGPAFSFAQAVSSGLTPAARGEDGSKILTDPNWKPVFLNDQQNETLIALSDVIIPASDTPGAKEALVNRFLDLLLSVQPVEFQKQFTDALTFIDGESQKQLGKDFRDLTPGDQTWLLTPWAFARQPSHWTARYKTGEEAPDLGQQNCELLKVLIATAYYGSEIGQKELGWDGEITHGPYQGCEHPTATHKTTHT